jgi:hypothetical protein
MTKVVFSSGGQALQKMNYVFILADFSAPFLPIIVYP